MEDQKTVVLVTGANAGLGYQIVRALCDSDRLYEILVGGRSLVRAQQAAKAAVDEFPATRSRTWPIQVDIEDDDSIKGAFSEVQTKFGRLDALINNAGMAPGEAHEEFPLLFNLTGGQFDQQFQAGKLTMRQTWNQSWNVSLRSGHCKMLLKLTFLGQHRRYPDHDNRIRASTPEVERSSPLVYYVRHFYPHRYRKSRPPNQ